MKTPEKNLITDYRSLFEEAKTVVVLGCSSNSYRTSFHIARYILQAGFHMIPVNPNEKEVLGQVCYSALDDLPEGVKIDIIDIFRNKIHTDDMVKEIVEWSKTSGQKPVIWTQLDVSTGEAKERARTHGFRYVENRCLMVEHQRLQ